MLPGGCAAKKLGACADDDSVTVTSPLPSNSALPLAAPSKVSLRAVFSFMALFALTPSSAQSAFFASSASTMARSWANASGPIRPREPPIRRTRP